jgi:sugar phosphate isomerase/epimerase
LTRRFFYAILIDKESKCEKGELAMQAMQKKRNLGCIMTGYHGCPWEESIRYVADAGFDCIFTGYYGIGDRTPHDQLQVFAREAERLGMFVESVHASFDRINDIWLPGEGGEFQVNRLLDTIGGCADAGVPIVVVHLSSGVNAPCICDLGRDRWDRVVEYAGERGVKVAFENQRLLANLAFVMERYRDLPQVGFCWDMGHETCFAGGREYLPLFGNRLICTHLHDNLQQPEGDLHLIPFDGSIDMERKMGQIRACGYTGTLMLEVLSGASTVYTDTDPQTYYRNTYAAAVRLRALVDGE